MNGRRVAVVLAVSVVTWCAAVLAGGVAWGLVRAWAWALDLPWAGWLPQVAGLLAAAASGAVLWVVATAAVEAASKGVE